MSKIGEKIKAVIIEEAKEYGIFLVGQKFAPGGILLQYFMDSEGPLDMNVMSKFARHINRLSEEMDLGERKFTLEVSCPGANKPLSDIRQLPKHLGKTLVVKVGEDEVEGEFKSLNGEELELEKKIFRSINSKKFTTEIVNIKWQDSSEIKVKLKY